MKTFVRFAVSLVAITVVCQASLALAEELPYYWASSNGQTNQQKPAGQGQTACNSCNQGEQCSEGGCGGCDPCGSMLECDPCSTFGIIGIAGFDAFKGVSDSYVNGASGPSNFGVVTGFNSAFLLSQDYNLGWQIGMTYGVYDFDGRETSADVSHSQQQTFVTMGFYHKADDCRRLSYGVVYDFMYNSEWGSYGVSPTLGQWRGQVEYATNTQNGFGMWASLGDRYSDINLAGSAYLRNRPISQVSMFWHHKFCSGADSWLWVGAPERCRLNLDQTLGEWTVGATVQVPLSDRLALYGNASYMHPSASAGAIASAESTWDVGMGIMWYFGGHARSNALNGKCQMPYMNVANNTTFLVDQDMVTRYVTP